MVHRSVPSRALLASTNLLRLGTPLLLILAGALTGCQRAATPSGDRAEVPAPTPSATPAASVTMPTENPPGKAAADVAKPVKAEVTGWTDKLEQARLPERPAAGTMLGQPFQPDQVKLTDKELVFRQGSRFGSYREVRVGLPRADALRPGVELTAVPGKADESPMMSVETHEEGASTPDGLLFTEGFLKVALGEAAAGRVPGKVYLGTAEEGKGYLAGTFAADDVRQDPAAAVLGDQDSPCLYGRIRVDGPGEGPVGAEYAGVNDKGDIRWGGIALPLKGDEVRAGNPTFKPRVSQLETGKDRTCVFHHCQVEPGQYLVHASWQGQPAAWKWVEVKAGTRARVDLGFEPTKAGRLEVTLPIGESEETVRVVPADPDGQVPIPEVGVWQIALPESMVSKVTPAAKDKDGKDKGAREGVAVFEGLPPGSYRVFAGRGQVRAQVEPGKTVKVEIR